jgi:thermitase
VNYIVKVLSSGQKYIFVLLVLIILSACSVSPTPTDQKITELATVSISATDTQANIEQMYGGQAIVFRPEAGFAILGFNEKPGLSTLATDPNATVTTPAVSIAGKNAWGGGNKAWGGGWNAWGGGWNTWGGGTSVVPTIPSENRNAWLQINLPQAHAISKNFGAGHTVAVIDTGLDLNHSMFTGRLAPSTDWKDFVDNDAVPQEVAGGDGYGHGTAVAGIILQIAPRAKILPIRVLGPNGIGDTDDVIAAIDWAIQKNARIINLSLGTNIDVAALKNMIDYATYLQYTVVTSAGNEGSATTLTYPAAYATTGTNASNLISVGSVESSAALSPFSNRGPALEITARGEYIYSAYPGNQVAHVVGTSFAAPQVAGAIALGYGETEPMYTANMENFLQNAADMHTSGSHKIMNLVSFVRAIPTFQRKNALFVVGSTTLNSGDNAVYSRLVELGYNVTLKTGLASTTADATGKELVLISSTITAADVNTKFRNVTTPVIVWEPLLFDDMGMTSTSTSAYGTTGGQISVNVVNSTHPLSAGFPSGPLTSFVSADTMTWGIPGTGAVKVATLTSDTNKAIIFGYDKGTSMVGMTAPGRRVGFYVHDTSAVNIQNHWASAYFAKSAITWAATGN